MTSLMAKFCETCGRGAQSSQTRSHSKIATKTRQLVNLQTRRIAGVTYKMCTRCMRNMTKGMKVLEQAGQIDRRLTSRSKRTAT